MADEAVFTGHPASGDETRLLAMCKALANPTRLGMVRYMAEHPRCITGEVAAHSGLAQATTSQHLAVLRESGLVCGVTEGPATCYCLDPEALGWFAERVDDLVGQLGLRADDGRDRVAVRDAGRCDVGEPSRPPFPAPIASISPLEGSMNTGDSRITEAVRARYGAIARSVMAGSTTSCCGDECCGKTGGVSRDGISMDLYDDAELAQVPGEAMVASLGCGNPTAVATLHPGEVVLDLGSGGGIDVLLSARRVGPRGFAFGLDMTDDMVALAQRNAEAAGARNVAFLKGDIAAIPLPDDSVDVIISNCVINLAVDKAPVFREAYRVLRPGGRFAVSDVVVHGGPPPGVGDAAAVRGDLAAWAGCLAGALSDTQYRDGLEEAGFADIELEVTRRYDAEDLPTSQPEAPGRLDTGPRAEVVARFAATTVRARKPA